MIACRLTTD